MRNTLISSLIFFGGVYVSLGANKTQGTILLMTLLIIVSLALLFNLSVGNGTTEHFDSQYANIYLLPPNVFNNGAVSPLVPNTNLMSWYIDDQFQQPNGPNRIYEQFMYAVNAIGPTLTNTGQTVSLTLNTGGGNSNGTKLDIKRTTPNMVQFIYNNYSSPPAFINAPAQTQISQVNKVPGQIYVNDECAIFGGEYVGQIPADAIYILQDGSKIYLLETNISSTATIVRMSNIQTNTSKYFEGRLNDMSQQKWTDGQGIDWFGQNVSINCSSPLLNGWKSKYIPVVKPIQIEGPTCNFRDTARCIFKGYNISGDLCDAGNGMPYSRPGLASYTNDDIKSWLKSLHDRNGGAPGQVREAEAVKEYIERCKNQPGFEYLRDVLPQQNLAQQVQATQAQSVVQPQAQPMPQPQPQPSKAAQGVGMADIKCRRILEQPPNPPFNTIAGRYANTIESIQFRDANNNMVESGMSQQGKEFSYQCPDGTNIVGYDINNQGKERPDTSIFGGFGPVYCADGTVVGTGLGKEKTQTIGQRPQTELSGYSLVDGNQLAFDDSLMGKINESNLEQCAYVCNFLKDSCGGFTYDNGNKTCGLAYSIDRAKIRPKTGGRTYQKLSNSTRK